MFRYLFVYFNVPTQLPFKNIDSALLFKAEMDLGSLNSSTFSFFSATAEEKTRNDINNTKIREGKMDIKTYVQTVDGLEQWNPLTKTEFPVSVDFLKSDIFPAFQVDLPDFENNEYTVDEFLVMVKNHSDLQAVSVIKERFGYMVNDTICEVGNILINGAKVMTINSESTELDDIKKTMSDVGLDGVENINYLQAIKRVLGWIDKPLAN